MEKRIEIHAPLPAQPCPLRVSSRHPPSVRKLLGAQSLQGGLLGVGATVLGLEARCSLSASTPPAFGAAQNDVAGFNQKLSLRRLWYGNAATADVFVKCPSLTAAREN